MNKQNETTPPAPLHRLVGQLPRCPGFRYSPKIREQSYNGTTVFCVQQKGFWMDASIVGPTKHTEDEAIKAWKRLLKAKP